MGKKAKKGKRVLKTSDFLPKVEKTRQSITTDGLMRRGKIPTTLSDAERVANDAKVDKQ